MNHCVRETNVWLTLKFFTKRLSSIETDSHLNIVVIVQITICPMRVAVLTSVIHRQRILKSNVLFCQAHAEEVNFLNPGPV